MFNHYTYDVGRWPQYAVFHRSLWPKKNQFQIFDEVKLDQGRYDLMTNIQNCIFDLLEYMKNIQMYA